MLDANIPSRSEKSLEEICRLCAGDYAKSGSGSARRGMLATPRVTWSSSSIPIAREWMRSITRLHSHWILSRHHSSALCFIWVMLIQHWPYFQYSHTAAALVEMCAQCVINTHGGGGGGRRRLSRSRNGKILTLVPELGFAPNKYTLRACE